MSGKRHGFTFIEVVLVLAISSALFIAVVNSVSGIIYTGRYNDTINGIADYLKSAYAATINVQNLRDDDEGSSTYCSISSSWSGNKPLTDSAVDTEHDNYPGRTRCAIYGKLITFGEQNQNIIRSYDVIGSVYNENFKNPTNINNFNGTDSEVLQALQAVGANVVTFKPDKTSSTKCSIDVAGHDDSYVPLWESAIELPGDPSLPYDKRHDVFRGAILITRSPINGTIHTYYYQPGPTDSSPTIEVQQFIEDEKAKGDSRECSTSFTADEHKQSLLYGALINNKMKSGDVTFCIGSQDANDAYNGNRRAIRILSDGQNSSAVQVENLDSENNPCIK